jgi:hypothetical protein
MMPGRHCIMRNYNLNTSLNSRPQGDQSCNSDGKDEKNIILVVKALGM